jgi:hypothetical protein
VSRLYREKVEKEGIAYRPGLVALNVRLAVYRTKLLQSDWQPLETPQIRLTGFNFDTVCDTIIV